MCRVEPAVGLHHPTCEYFLQRDASRPALASYMRNLDDTPPFALTLKTKENMQDTLQVIYAFLSHLKQCFGIFNRLKPFKEMHESSHIVSISLYLIKIEERSLAFDGKQTPIHNMLQM